MEATVVRRPLMAALHRTNEVAYGRIVPAAIWIFFSIPYLERLTAAQTPIDALQALVSLTFSLLVVALFIVRRPVISKRSDVPGAIIALAGTFSPLLFGFMKVSERHTLITAGTALTIFGLVFSIISMAYLGRCFGLFPEVRGLVTHGPYRIIRHPLYLGEIVAVFGMAVSSLSAVSLLVWLSFAALQMWRAKNEERAITRMFPKYGDYQCTTKTVIPYVW